MNHDSADQPADRPMEGELRRYFEEFNAGGADLFHDTFLNLDPTTISFVTRDQLRASLPMRAKLFAALGVTGLTIADIDPIELDAQHVLVRTTWTASMTDPDAEPLVLRSTYLLRRYEGSWQILAYLNHQDLKAMLATRARELPN